MRKVGKPGAGAATKGKSWQSFWNKSCIFIWLIGSWPARIRIDSGRARQ
jgi:hypothetical protein